MVRVILENVFVLHTKPYRDSSLLVDLFSRQYGRVRVVARSARGPKSRFKGQLQPFTSLLASWSGRSELKSLSQLEVHGVAYELPGDCLLCAFYLNELLVRLLKIEDPCVALFDLYQTTLDRLDAGQDVHDTLRVFETTLLTQLGYGLRWDKEAYNDHDILPDQWYRYESEVGFVLQQSHSESEQLILGEVLLALAQSTPIPAHCRAQAKGLLRLIISEQLGGRPLKSRDLMR